MNIVKVNYLGDGAITKKAITMHVSDFVKCMR